MFVTPPLSAINSFNSLTSYKTNKEDTEKVFFFIKGSVPSPLKSPPCLFRGCAPAPNFSRKETFSVPSNVRFSAVKLDKLPDGYTEKNHDDFKLVTHGENILRIVNCLIKNENQYDIYTKDTSKKFNLYKLKNTFVFVPKKDKTLPVIEYETSQDMSRAITKEFISVTSTDINLKCEFESMQNLTQLNKTDTDNNFSFKSAKSAFNKLKDFVKNEILLEKERISLLSAEDEAKELELDKLFPKQNTQT